MLALKVTHASSRIGVPLVYALAVYSRSKVFSQVSQVDAEMKMMRKRFEARKLLEEDGGREQGAHI